MREDFNIKAVVESLVQKGIISADAGTDVVRQRHQRAQIELCIQEVMKGGAPAYISLCDVLDEHGYNSVVDALHGTPTVPGLITYNSTSVLLYTCIMFLYLLSLPACGQLG